MQCHNNVDAINEVLKLLLPIPSKTIHFIKILNPIDAINPVIIPIKLTRVTNYFYSRKPTLEEDEDHGILKKELRVEASPLDSSSTEFIRQEQSMLDYRGWFVIPTTPTRRPLYLNFVTLYAHYAADVIDDDNLITMLESFIIILLLWVAQVNTGSYLCLIIWLLQRNITFHLKKLFIQCSIPQSILSTQCCIIMLVQDKSLSPKMQKTGVLFVQW